MRSDYQLVQLANGATTLFSTSYGEKLHPGLGPLAEADLLYVRQLQICERLQAQAGEFVIWDIGLGAAANALATLRATRQISGKLRLISFDNTREPLKFALNHAGALGYLTGYENCLAELLELNHVQFQNGKLAVDWKFHHGDFPQLISGSRRSDDTHELKTEIQPESPHAVFYDAFSPAKNPAMWTLPLFENLFQALDPARPCSLTTYSRSTLLRVTLLRAGFFVGTGEATGMKEETTIAANAMDLIIAPLTGRWLERAMRSSSAEPLQEPVYARAPLSAATAEKLRQHPQFN